MRFIQMRIRRDHLRLKPDTKLQTDRVDLIYQSFQPPGKLLCIDHPIPQRTVITVALSEPAVVHHQHLNSTLLGFFCDCKQLFRVKVKIRRFPVIDENRPLFMIILAPDQVISVEVMIASCHLTQALS